MTKTLLLVGAAVRSQLRWLSQHIYTALVLTPLVVGMTYASASRLAENIALWQPSPPAAAIVAVVFTICLIALSLSRSSAEIYHIRRPESSFDALPVAASDHLHAGLAARLIRTTVAGAMIFTMIALLGIEGLFDASRLFRLALFVVLLAVAQVFAAINWIHWGHLKNKSIAAGAFVLLAFSALIAGLLLVVFIAPEKPAPSIRQWIVPAGMISVIALYMLLYFQHERWRTGDIEYARRLQLSGRLNVFKLSVLKKRFGVVVAAQLARDLQLTIRAFSSAVYVVATISLLTLIILVIAITQGLLPPPHNISGWFDQTWLPEMMATKIACGLITATLVALLPVLIAYELPLLWLERAIGTTGFDIWQAKMLYGRTVSSLAPLTAWIVSMLTGRLLFSYSIPLLLECIWLWWVVSSISSALAFEMPTRAGLSIIIMLTIGIGVGVITAMLWPFSLILYFYAMQALKDRGRARARYYLMTEGD